MRVSQSFYQKSSLHFPKITQSRQIDRQTASSRTSKVNGELCKREEAKAHAPSDGGHENGNTDKGQGESEEDHAGPPCTCGHR